MSTKRGRRIIYARPSFLEGMARVLDIGGTLEEYDFGSVDRERDIAAAEARKAEAEARKAEAEARKAEARKAEANGRERDDVAGFWDDDIEEMRSDWQAIGDDMRAVIGDYDYYYLIDPEGKAQGEPES